VGEGEEQRFEVAADPSRTDRPGILTGCDDDQGLTTCEAAVAVAPRHPELRIQIAVREPAGEDPVEPTLQNRRHAVPPERELHDEQFGSGDLGLLLAHLRRHLPASVSLADQFGDVSGCTGEVAEVVVAEDRVEALRVQI
jgi:hypothetical protein